MLGALPSSRQITVQSIDQRPERLLAVSERYRDGVERRAAVLRATRRPPCGRKRRSARLEA